MYYTECVVWWCLLPLCCLSSFVVIVWFTPKVGPCMVHAPCMCVCVVPLEEGKKFGKIFSFFKREENIVKGEGNWVRGRGK